MPPDDKIGNRMSLIWRGAWRGALGGLLWSVPIGLLCALSVLLTARPGENVWYFVFQAFLWTVLIWVSIAAAVGAQQAREQTMSDTHLAILRGYVFWACLQATLFSSPVVALFVVGTWGYGPIGAILGGLTIMGIWVGCAAAVGHARGMDEVLKFQTREQQEVDLTLRAGPEPLAEHWDADTLARRRQALETAIVSRFGPLDDDRLHRLRTWDQDRILEASQKLPTAHSLDELDD